MRIVKLLYTTNRKNRQTVLLAFGERRVQGPVTQKAVMKKLKEE